MAQGCTRHGRAPCVGDAAQSHDVTDAMGSTPTYRFICPQCSHQGQLPWPGPNERPRCPACGAAFLPPNRQRAGSDQIVIEEEDAEPVATGSGAESAGQNRPGSSRRREAAEAVHRGGTASLAPGRAAPAAEAAVEPQPWPVLGLLLPVAGRFLLSLPAAARWLVLSFTLVLPCLLLRRNSPPVDSLDEDHVTAWIVFLLCSGAGVVCSLAWLVAANNVWLAVLRDSASGLDDVENWSDNFWLDSIGEVIYLVNALFLAALPGFAITQFTEASGAWLPASVVVLFPLVLLSMLDASSAFVPLTLTVVVSLLTSARGWLLFFVQSALLIWGGAWLARVIWKYGELSSLVAGCCILVAAGMLYFRLLGRLAWYAGVSSPPQRP